MQRRVNQSSSKRSADRGEVSIGRQAGVLLLLRRKLDEMSSIPSDKPVLDGMAGRRARHETRAGRRRDIVELAVCYGLILIALWVPRGPDRYFDWATLIWVIVTTARRFPGWRETGLTWHGFVGSLWLVGLAVAVTAGAFALASQYHTLQGTIVPGALLRRYWMYSVWALIQEFLLLNFFLLRFLRLLPGKWMAVAGTAGLFAFAHVPNPVLAPLTVIWGFIVCAIFLHYRNLYTVALSHAILGICIAMSVPAGADHHMRVGYGYLTYRPHHRNVNDSATHHTFSG